MAACAAHEAEPGGAHGDVNTGSDEDSGGMEDVGTDASSTDTGYWDPLEDTGTAGDAGAPVADAGSDAGEIGNVCSEEYEKMVNTSGPSPRVAPVPWKIVAGGSATYRKTTISATWKGVRKLGTPVHFNCPPTASPLGLKCRATRGLAFQHAASGSKTIVFAVSIPLQALELPKQGTSVQLTYFKDSEHAQFQVRRKSDGRLVLALRAAESDDKRGRGQSNPERFVNDYGPFQVAIRAEIGRSESAYCLAQDHCGRLLRVEPLTVASSQQREIQPGSTVDFTASNEDFRFWHVVSFRRNQELGSEASCKDITQPAASYAVARLK